MECPKCHIIVDDNQKVCPNCNKVLLLECPNCHELGESAVCSKCGYTILVKCSKCSKITPYEKVKCSKCNFPLSTSLAYQECESDEFATLLVEFGSLKRIRRLLKSQDLYIKFLCKIKNLLQAQLKGLDCKVVSYGDSYEINFNKELSLATSSNKAVRLALKMINAFVDTNSKIMEELSLPLNLNITIYKKNSEHLQNPASFVNNVKLLNIKKTDKKFLKGLQIKLDQFVRDEISKDYKTDSLYTLEENGKNIVFYEIVLDNYVLPPSSNADALLQVEPKKINKKQAQEEDKDLYSFKVFDINAKCKFKRTTAVKFWEILPEVNLEKGGKIIALRSKPELGLDINELEVYLTKQDFRVLRVCCTEEMNYNPWGFFKAVFREYFNLPLIIDVNAISGIDAKVINFHKPLFDLYFNKPVKAMSPEDARFTYMEAWSKFFKVLVNTVIIIEGFEKLDDTSLQSLELYFDKFTNIKPNFVFITPEDLSVHSKIKGLLRTENYTEFVLKRSSIDSCISTIKLDATDFIQSFCYEKICDLFDGSYLYFQNALKYFKDSDVLIQFDDKLLVKSKKTAVLSKDLKTLYKSRIKPLGKNMDLSLILAYSTILGPSIDFKTLQLLELKDIDKNLKTLESMGFISLNSNRMFINDYNVLASVMKQSLKKDIEQFLAKTIMAKLSKYLDSTTMLVAMGILEVYKEEYLVLWKNSQFALNTGDFDAYLKNCLGFLSLVGLVGDNISQDVIEENKKEVFNNVLMTLYAYSPAKIYFIENALLMDAINENDNEKIVKLSNLMLQGALISSNYTDAQGLLHNILSRMPNATLISKGVINTKFLLLSLVNIEILYNIGKFRQCIEVANEVLSVLSKSIIEKVKPASFSTNLFVSHIMETLRLVGFAKLFVLDNDMEDFFESIKNALGVDLPEKDCILAIKDFLSGKVYPLPDVENCSPFAKVIYLILQEAERLTDNYKQFAQNIYQAKLLALDIHQKELELFCDLLIAFAYSKISATEKANAIYSDVMSYADSSALFNILAISKYYSALLALEQQDYEKALLIVNDMLAIIRRNENQAQVMFAIFEKLYIRIIEAQNNTSVDTEAEEMKLTELKISLKNLIGD